MDLEIGLACVIVGVLVVSLRWLAAYNRYEEVHRDSEWEK